VSRRKPKIEYAYGNASQHPRLKRGWHVEQQGDHVLHVRNGYKAVVCSGEAHSNAFIDHCMECLGHTWGFVAEPVK
jgi:hypothetical protein